MGSKDESVQVSPDLDEATQTEQFPKQLSVELTREISISVNRFLHSSYWFLSLEMRFLELNLPTLAHMVHIRDKECGGRARLLLRRMSEDTAGFLLADIARPPHLHNSSPNICVTYLTQLEAWLLEGLARAYSLMEAKEEDRNYHALHNLTLKEVVKEALDYQKIKVREAQQLLGIQPVV